MKYLVIAFIGMLLGAAAAGAILYFNPLTDERAPRTDEFEQALRYELPEDALTFARGDQVPLPDAGGAAADELWEEAIKRTALLGVTLHDAEGRPAALATRFLAGSRDTDLLLRGVLVEDHWLITFPGEGSLFVRAESNVWPLLKDAVIPVRLLGREWQGPLELTPTAGPSASGAALLIGATGRFAALRGEAAEHYRLTDVEPLAADAEIVLDLATAAAAAAP